MKKVQFFILAIILTTAVADEAWDIDWSQVRPRTEAPGFWDNRFFQPKMMPRLSFEVKSDVAGRIVGGWEVEPNAHPYQAGLLLRMGSSVFLCGGSVIGPHYILTAAHCPENTESTQVILGAHQINEIEETQQRRDVNSSNYRCHPLYNSWTLQNDICVLLLSSRIEYNKFVLPIPLPREFKDRNFVGYNATVSGWGRTTDSSWETSPVLRAVTNVVITNDECAAVYGNRTVIESTICMRNFGNATCHGDSGLN